MNLGELMSVGIPFVPYKGQPIDELLAEGFKISKTKARNYQKQKAVKFRIFKGEPDIMVIILGKHDLMVTAKVREY